MIGLLELLLSIVYKQDNCLSDTSSQLPVLMPLQLFLLLVQFMLKVSSPKTSTPTPAIYPNAQRSPIPAWV
jgi:hypothetical protein